MTETMTTKEYLNISDSPNGKLVNRAHKKKRPVFSCERCRGTFLQATANTHCTARSLLINYPI